MRYLLLGSLTSAHHAGCFAVNCSPGVQVADRNYSQTIHRECRRYQIFTMWTLSRSYWLQLDFILFLGISNRIQFRKRWSSKAALRLKEAREIHTESGPFNKIWKWNWRGNTCSWSEVQAPTCAHHTKCLPVKCSPEIQEADRDSSQTIHRECRRSQTSTI